MYDNEVAYPPASRYLPRLKRVPEAFNSTLAYIIGQSDDLPSFGEIDTLLQALLGDKGRQFIDKFLGDIRKDVAFVMDDGNLKNHPETANQRSPSLIQLATERSTNATLRGIKKHYNFRVASLQKRGLFRRFREKIVTPVKNWLNRVISPQIDGTLDDVVREIQPEIHYELATSMALVSRRLPEIVRSNINHWLPTKYQIPPPLENGEPAELDAASKAGIYGRVRRFLLEISEKIVGPVKALLEHFLNHVEPAIMVKLRATTEERLVKKLQGIYTPASGIPL